MDCQHVQEAILDAFDEPASAAAPDTIAAHLAGCPACATFAVRQQALDAQLSATLVPAGLSPGFRAALRRRIDLETRRLRLDALPDLVHFASCGAATLLCVVLLPFDAWMIAATGATAALSTYVLLAAARHSFEDLD
jgi:predicted anti-sigma-YlaC factor YlaD